MCWGKMRRLKTQCLLCWSKIATTKMTAGAVASFHGLGKQVIFSWYLPGKHLPVMGIPHLSFVFLYEWCNCNYFEPRYSLCVEPRICFLQEQDIALAQQRDIVLVWKQYELYVVLVQKQAIALVRIKDMVLVQTQDFVLVQQLDMFAL